MWDKPRAEIPWDRLNTLFELENLDPDMNSYGEPLTMAIAANRPIGDPDEVLRCIQGITQLSGLIAKVTKADEGGDIELDQGDIAAISEVQEIIRVLSLRLEQSVRIQRLAQAPQGRKGGSGYAPKVGIEPGAISRNVL